MKHTVIFILAAGLLAGAALVARKTLFPVAVAPLTIVQPVSAEAASDFDHRHGAFTKILKASVQDERVDYASLKKSPGPLSAYLGSLAAVKKLEFQAWSEAQQLAYLINLYNAATIQLVVEHYPLKSIKDIGNIFKGPWDQAVVPLFGEHVTLNYLEHDLIRANYTEPRIHFALVCAAVGCPPLRAEAFVPDRLGEQMDEQGRIFLATPSKNRVDKAEDVLHLSEIFKWYKQDFTSKAGSVESFVAPYFKDADRKAILSGELEIEYTDYDWSLNGQSY